jgi:predicted O-methyltransferase YrrM
MTREEALAAAEKVPGWMSRRELEWLYDNAAGRFVEIGSLMGRSATAVGLKLRETGGRLHCVDIWPDGFARRLVPEGRTAVDVFKETAIRHDLRPVVFMMESLAAAGLFEDGSLDVVFIDGDHDMIREDIRAWRPKLREGSLLCGHNYEPTGPVRPGVDELFPDGQVELVDTIWSVRL